MAINDGLAVTCSDLQAVGGTRLVAIRAWVAGDTATYDNTYHTITSILDTGGSTATWGVFESRIESSSMNITASGEGKNFMTYECDVQLFLPKMTSTMMDRLQELADNCLMVIVFGNNDASTSETATSTDFENNKVFGVSEKFRNQDDQVRNQTYAKLVSVEGGTGSAFSDEIGVTITIKCTQYEAPRRYTEPGVTLAADGLSLTTA
jgi:hypothetical protein